MGDVLLSVDLVVTLDPALAGESDPPHGVGVVTMTGLNLAEIVVVIILNSPVNFVVGDVGVVHVLLSVRLAVNIGGGNSDESEENDCDL